MKTALTRLVSSMKFWTTLIGIVAYALAKYGIDVDQQTQLVIAGFFLALLGGQAATDAGKEAAREKSRQPSIGGVGGDVNLSVVPPPEAS